MIKICVGMCGERVQEPAGQNCIGQAVVDEVDCTGYLWLVERQSGVIPDSGAVPTPSQAVVVDVDCTGHLWFRGAEWSHSG